MKKILNRERYNQLITAEVEMVRLRGLLADANVRAAAAEGAATELRATVELLRAAMAELALADKVASLKAMVAAQQQQLDQCLVRATQPPTTPVVMPR